MREGWRSEVLGFRNFEPELQIPPFSHVSRFMLHGLWYWSTLFYQQPVRVGEARTYRGQLGTAETLAGL